MHVSSYSREYVITIDDNGVISGRPADAKNIDDKKANNQANERAVREAMMMACISSCTCMTKTPDYTYHAQHCGYKILQTALHAPYDESALDAVIAQARDSQRRLMYRAIGKVWYEQGLDVRGADITAFIQAIQSREGENDPK